MSFDIEQLHNQNAINDYFYDQLSRNLAYLENDDQRQAYINEAIMMTDIGVSSDEDRKHFYYISSYVDDILHDITDKLVGYTNHSKIVANIYKNKDKFPINDIISLYDAVAVAAQKIGIPVKQDILNRIHMRYGVGEKLAYPQGYSVSPISTQYNIGAWMRATRDIYARANNGQNFDEALDAVIGRWSNMEQLDFKHWLKFYQEGGHNKYKIARHIPSNEGGYHLPISYDDLKGKLPVPMRYVMPNVPEQKNDVEDQNSVRERIESQRSKIISRLNAAEKLLSSLDGQFFAADDQEFMLKLLQDLKRKVQTANKLTARSSLFEDFIVRTGNYLEEIGKRKASRFFFKIAQENNEGKDDPMGGLMDNLTGPVPPLPEDGGGSGDASAGAPAPEPSSDEGSGKSSGESSSKAKNETDEAFREFFALLETGVADIEDDELDKTADRYADIVVEAQPAPEGEFRPPRPEKPIEAELPPSTDIEQEETNIGDAVEAALDGVTVHDIIITLEELSGLFKKREISRRLAMVDIMMDKLGIGSFFPQLGEALRSTLDSNQYVSTRIEDILTKLRGLEAVDNAGADKILEPDKAVAPENIGLQRGLESMEEKEQERKDRRRQREDKKLENAEQGQQPPPSGAGAEAPAELAGPAGVEQSRPVPIR